jgi:LysR family transcriptional regulator, transcriptional activator of nhaA
VVVQDELRAGPLLRVRQFTDLKENFYAITTPRRHRIERQERLLGEMG